MKGSVGPARGHGGRIALPQGVVFPLSAALVLIFVALGLTYADAVFDSFDSAKESVTRNAGWFFLLSVNGFLGFCLYLACSRYGAVRLGGSNARPDYSYLSWVAMLFSAGMGIGLVFWSVAEPVMHFASPALASIEAESPGAARWALAFTYFHWGLHAWGIYGVVGLALAYFGYNRRLPFTIRSAFYPILGDRIHGWMGDAIDILAILATLFGVATSLGFGAQQIDAGLVHVFGGEVGTSSQIWIIAVVTALATLSVVLGLDKGIRRLSEANLGLAAILLAFVAIGGPTVALLNGFVQNLGNYAQELIFLSTWADTYQQSGWRQAWTIFYWAWWISWSPFVGMFIARISRGRTVREFLVGVLLVPTLLTFIWMSVFGGSALELALAGDESVVRAVESNEAASLFALLDHLPWTAVVSMIALVVIATFFVTSSDSGSLVIDTIASGGDLNPPIWQRIFWATLEGLVAASLLVIGGNQSLSAFQAATVISGFPFCIALVIVCFGLLKALRSDHAAKERLA